jgi:hypothetical protein
MMVMECGAYLVCDCFVKAHFCVEPSAHSCATLCQAVQCWQ